MNNFNAMLMDPMQLGENVRNAILMGAQQRAFGDYAKNPSMGAAQGVAGLNPGLGMQLMDREDKRAAEAAKQEQAMRAQELQRRAAAGDKTALLELAGLDINAWNTIGDNERQQTNDRIDYIGNAALQISQLPPDQRPRAWDMAINQGVQMGFSDLAQYRGQYSEEALNGVLAQAGMIKDALGLAEPKYMAVPPGGTLVNTRSPQAVQQFGAQPQQPQGPLSGQPFTFEQYQGAVNGLGPQGAAQWLQRNGIAIQVQTPDQARQLPSGTPIILPDGSQGRVP